MTKVATSCARPDVSSGWSGQTARGRGLWDRPVATRLADLGRKVDVAEEQLFLRLALFGTAERRGHPDDRSALRLAVHSPVHQRAQLARLRIPALSLAELGQRGVHLAGRREPLVSILREGLANDRVELVGNVRLRREGGDLAGEDRGDRGRDVGAAEQPPRGQQLVHDDAEGEDVRAVVELFALELLGATCTRTCP